MGCRVQPHHVPISFVHFADRSSGGDPEFIGQVLGSSGFSPERFKILFKIWGTKVDNLRESVKPVIMDVTRNYFRSLGINPAAIENMDLVFNTPDVLDEMEMQEIRKAKSEADEKFTNVANVLAQVNVKTAGK